MAEQISIEISDNVDGNIAKKIKVISENAREASSAIETLKGELARIAETAALGRLQVEVNKLAVSEAKAAIAAQSLSIAQDKAAISDAKAAIAKQKLITEIQRAETATAAAAAAEARRFVIAQQLNTESARTATQEANAAAAMQRSELAALKLATAKQKIVDADERLTRQSELATARTAEQAARLEASLNREIALYGEVSRTATAKYDLESGSLKNLTAAQKESILGLTQRLDALDNANAAFNANASNINKAGKAYQNFGNISRQVGYQFQDAVVQLQGGQNAALVLSQQGSQLASVFSPMLGLFVALVGVVGGAFLNSLFNTGEAAKKLAEDVKSLVGDMKELSDIQKEVLNRGLALSLEDETKKYEEQTKAIDKQKESIAKLQAQQGKMQTVAIQGGVGSGGGAAIVVAIDNTKKLKEANDELTRSEVAHSKSLQDIKKLQDPLGLGQKLVDMKQELALSELQTKATGLQSKAYYELLGSQKGYKDDQLKEFVATSMLLDQRKQQLQDDKKLEVAAENRAAAIAKVNAQLDDELARMNVLKPARDEQAKFDAINEQLIGKKITLTNAEATSIKTRIAAIQDNAKIQSELDRIYQESIGPVEQFNATLAASKTLLDRGAISQADYNKAIIVGTTTLAKAVDPLFEYNKALADQDAILKELPQNRETATRLQELSNQLTERGIPLEQQQLDLRRQEIEMSVEKNRVAQEELQIYNSTAGARQQYADQLAAIVKLKNDPAMTKGDIAQAVQQAAPNLDFGNTQVDFDTQAQRYQDMYDQVKLLRQADLIDEQTAAGVRVKIWASQQANQLKTTQTFFSSLEGFSKSSNSRLAAIGKAASIANAIVNTYTAATGAYASLASIPYVGPVLGAAAAAAAIAAGMANVQAIRSAPTGQGYMAGGYTGDAPVNEVAGVVHGQEFVMNAQATSRIGASNLQALQSGAATIQHKAASPSTVSGTGLSLNVTINNQIPNAQFEVKQIDEATVEIIAKRVLNEQVDGVTARHLSDPSSKTSRSLSSNTKTQRNF